ncbi:MAG: class I SAM-dependent methyltransferase [Enhydrobacter sp.]|nr:class I SAM-dependent methyltransferase [Enhydrobacter sp.]
MDDPALLAEQLAYYQARAQEYDESVQQTGRFSGPGLPAVDTEWNHIVQAVLGLGPQGTALELACGTGLWTQHLAQIAGQLTALDGAVEMLATNRRKLGNPAIEYVQADLFDWQPQAQYDLVFAAFWLSHVPADLLAGHLQQIRRAVAPGGRLFLVDEPAGGQQLSGSTAGQVQERQLHDGSRFRIVKVYYDPDQLAEQLCSLGFGQADVWQGDYFFCLQARPQE